MNYQKTIEENMKHLKSNLTDWSALEIKGYHVDSEGRKLPIYEFPKDYNPADSLFLNKSAGENMNCELCGHEIKTAFYIVNHGRKLIMIVGSECITHFSEKSGAQLLNKKTIEIKKQDILTIRRALWAFNRRHIHKHYAGYGRYDEYNDLHKKPEIYKVWNKLNDSLKVLVPMFEKSLHEQPDANITRWHNRWYEPAKELLSEIVSFI